MRRHDPPVNPFNESTDPDDPLDAGSLGAQCARVVLGPVGRILSTSKTRYRHQHPTHQVVFNANIVTAHRGKLWFGDIDLATDAERLERLAITLGEAVFVLREFDARFATARSPDLRRAVESFSPYPDR